MPSTSAAVLVPLLTLLPLVFAEMAHHHHAGAPLLELNETEIALWHGSSLPSYYTIDWDGVDSIPIHYPGLIIAHAIFMCLAFFVALPLGIAMRSLKHSWRWTSVSGFFVFWTLGNGASSLYRKRTPNMYEGSVHGRYGTWVFWLSLIITAVDLSGIFARLARFFRSNGGISFRTFVSFFSSKASEKSGYASVVTEPEELESFINKSEARPNDDTTHWIDRVHSHRRNHSTPMSSSSDRTAFEEVRRVGSFHSDDTLHIFDEPLAMKVHPLKRFAYAVRALLERSFLLVGFAELLIGVVVYTGGCRGNYVNGCLAHLIKGGVFWSYGLFSFARYLGSFSEYGWSWNRPPSAHISAEFVESALIFLYGSTNVWMERFGANPNDPYTTKQIQHISIAVMFWLTGLVAMAIESKSVRRCMGSLALQQSSSLSKNVEEPATYTSSFNPFPALVVGVTGVSMAAHAQTYLFQVQIHVLWGNMLLAAAVLRSLTYFFLWISPPMSILPSRPPSEALTSFFLACGGLMFMFSTEEVTFAAMRRQYDDQMMFVNVAVAITCIALCWTVCVVGFKGWLVSREKHLRIYPHGDA